MDTISKDYYITKSFFDILTLREKLPAEGFPDLDS
jgi:hypothetical protein